MTTAILFFPSQIEGRRSASKECCFCLVLRRPSRAAPGERRPRAPADAVGTLLTSKPSTHRGKNPVHTFFSGRNQGNKFFSGGFRHAFSFSPLAAEFWEADPGAAPRTPPTPQPSLPSLPHLHPAKRLGRGFSGLPVLGITACLTGREPAPNGGLVGIPRPLPGPVGGIRVSGGMRCRMVTPRLREGEAEIRHERGLAVEERSPRSTGLAFAPRRVPGSSGRQCPSSALRAAHTWP